MRGTLTSKRDIERLFASGRAGRTQILTVIAREAGPADGAGRIMVAAGRTIGSAVRRNRAKRVLREAVRRFGGPWCGQDVAVIAKPGLIDASPGEVEAALSRALGQAGVRR